MQQLQPSQEIIPPIRCAKHQPARRVRAGLPGAGSAFAVHRGEWGRPDLFSLPEVAQRELRDKSSRRRPKRSATAVSWVTTTTVRSGCAP